MTTAEQIDVVHVLLGKSRFLVTSERLLQLALGRLWEDNSIPYEAEVRLNEHDRIDFVLWGSLGVEVKVKGGWRDVQRQLARYAQSPRVSALMLVTTKTAHRNVPRTVGGKRVAMYQLMNSGL